MTPVPETLKAFTPEWIKNGLDLTRDEDPEFFSTDPAQLKKKFRIRPEIEMKKKIYLYFR